MDLYKQAYEQWRQGVEITCRHRTIKGGEPTCSDCLYDRIDNLEQDNKVLWCFCLSLLVGLSVIGLAVFILCVRN